MAMQVHRAMTLLRLQHLPRYSGSVTLFPMDGTARLADNLLAATTPTCSLLIRLFTPPLQALRTDLERTAGQRSQIRPSLLKSISFRTVRRSSRYLKAAQHNS